jgi:hypothetical protein
MQKGFKVCGGLACLAALLLGGLGMTADPLTLEGKPAPDVELTAVGAGGKSEQVKLSSFKGKKNVVLAFYPKAMTPG